MKFADISRNKILPHARGFVLGIASVIGLASCALQYAAPTDDQTADLLVSTNAPLAVLFYRDATTCTDALQVPQPTVGQISSYKIPANKDFALRFFYFTGNSFAWASCKENIVSFHPEKGGVYVLHYALTDEVCTWALNQKTNEHEAPVSLSKRERDPNITSMGGEGSWCKAKAS